MLAPIFGQFEIIPLLLLFHPQYKTIKFLCQYLFIHHDENLLKEEKEENDRKVSSLEPFLESCLQVRKLTKKIEDADYIIVCVGEETYTEKPGDIRDLALSQGQIEYTRQLKENSRLSANVIVVYFGGR